MNKQMTSCTITNVLSIHSARSAKVEAKITIETKTALSKKCWTLGLSESDYIARLLGMVFKTLPLALSEVRRRA